MNVYFGTLFDLVLESMRLLKAEYPAELLTPTISIIQQLQSKSTHSVNEELMRISTAHKAVKESVAESVERSADEGYEEIPDSRSCTTLGTSSWTAGRSSLRMGSNSSRRSSLRRSDRRGTGRKIVIIYE